jgi:hypothetical protein
MNDPDDQHSNYQKLKIAVFGAVPSHLMNEMISKFTAGERCVIHASPTALVEVEFQMKMIENDFQECGAALILYCDYSSFSSLGLEIDHLRSLRPTAEDFNIMIVGIHTDRSKKEIATTQGQRFALLQRCLFQEIDLNVQDSIDYTLISLVNIAYRSGVLGHSRHSKPQGQEKIETNTIPTPNSSRPSTPNFEECDLNSDQPIPLEEKNEPHVDVKSNLWDRTIDLLDWLIPSQSDDDAYGDEWDRSLSVYESIPVHIKGSGSSEISKAERFATSNLVHYLTLPRTVSLSSFAPRSSSLRK